MLDTTLYKRLWHTTRYVRCVGYNLVQKRKANYKIGWLCWLKLSIIKCGELQYRWGVLVTMYYKRVRQTTRQVGFFGYELVWSMDHNKISGVYWSQLSTQFPLMPMWVLTPCLRKLDRSAFPHINSYGYFGAHVCKFIFKHFPKPLTSHIQSFETLG